MEHHYNVYIIASRTHVLYVGVTNCIERRVGNTGMMVPRALQQIIDAIGWSGLNGASTSVMPSGARSKLNAGRGRRRYG
jgi:hypothetical protein